jgi:hypothetical protein
LRGKDKRDTSPIHPLKIAFGEDAAQPLQVTYGCIGLGD